MSLPARAPRPSKIASTQSSLHRHTHAAAITVSLSSRSRISSRDVLWAVSEQHPQQPERGHVSVVRAAWRRKDSKNIAGRANTLLLTLKNTSCETKEELFAALDSWAAFQLDFPLLAVRRSLNLLQRNKQWLRLLQVAKWMIARGHGKTFGTFELMMEALAELGRYDELDVMWKRVVTRHLDSVPRATFGRVMSLYSRHRQPLKVLEVYGSADALGVKLDVGMMSLVHAAMVAVGAHEHARGFRVLNDNDIGSVPVPGGYDRQEEEFELQQDMLIENL